MTPLTARQIAESTGGTLVAGDAAVSVDRVSTDSRTAADRCVFVALRGDHFDGHDHLEQARAQGATIALVDRAIERTFAGMTLVQVPDTRRALGRLAQVVRRSVTRPKVIAIAGSNGKTSTKNALHAVLRQTLRGTASPKSFNNDIGVPATLFPVDADDDYVILEIGTNHPGEVEHLSRMSEPDIAVITSIGEEHLEFFGSLDNVRRENAAIVAGLRAGGLLVVTGDDAELAGHLCHEGPTIVFSSPPPLAGGGGGRGSVAELRNSTRSPLPLPPPSRGGGKELTASHARVTLDGTHFECEGVDYSIPAIGVHFATNALSVIAVARHLGLDDATIRTGLAAADASEMRMQKRVCRGVTLLNDAYNANPTSMRAALDTLRAIEWAGRKIVVLGEMKELGTHAAAAHADVAGAVIADVVFAIGEAWRTPAAAIGATWFADSVEAAAAISAAVRPGDLVLLKGSRSMRLERVADAIAAVHG